MTAKNELKSIPVFGNLDEPELAIMAPLLNGITYMPESVIFVEGSICQGIFFIKQGVVQLRKLLPNGHNLLMRVLRDGEIIDSFSWTDSDNHYTAVAIKPTTVMFLGKEELDHLADSYPALLYKLMKNFSNRAALSLNQVQNDLVDISKYVDGGTYTSGTTG